jgi:hypothetical protein
MEAEGSAGGTAEVRVRDPASRDQEPVAWRRGRFAERVRREWNPVRTATIEAARSGDGYDVAALAAAIQRAIGGDNEAIRARLTEFAAAEELGAPAGPDPLLRPGHA